MNYLPHQQRVVSEHQDLFDKLTKLRSFVCTDLFKSLDRAEQDRLISQKLFMEGYLNVLKQRIDAFPKLSDDLPDDYEV